MDQKRIMSELFQEVVLVLGGVFAMNGTDDDTVSQAASGLERAWQRAQLKMRKLAKPNLVPHPEISSLLRLVKEESKEDTETVD